MPVYPLQFTRWEAPRESTRRAWWHLTLAALRVRKGSRVMRWVGLFWGVYLAFFLGATYLAGRAAELGAILGIGDLDVTGLPAWITDPATRIALFLFLQGLLLLIVGLYAGAGLIADDRRTGALALYLSKPVTRGQYIASRLAVSAWYIGRYTALPALGLLLFGILIAREPLAALADLRLVPAILAYWVVLTVLFGVSVLVLSSLTERGRTAGILFVVLWFLSDFAGNILNLAAGTKIGSLVDLDRILASSAIGLFRPEGTGWLEKSGMLAPPSWTLTAVAVYGLLGLWILWLRTRAGEGNR